MNSILLFFCWLYFYFRSIHISYLLLLEDIRFDTLFITSPLWGIFGFILIPILFMLYVSIESYELSKIVYKFYRKFFKEFKERK